MDWMFKNRLEDSLVPNVIEEEFKCMQLLEDFDTPPSDVPLSDHVKSMLTNLMQNRQWSFVTQVLMGYRSKIDDELYRRTIKEACRHADKYDLRHLLHYIPDDQLDSVLPQLVVRDLWYIVSQILQRGVCSKEQRRWVMREAVQRAEEQFVQDFVRDYADDMPSCLLAKLARRGLWLSVGEVLQLGVTEPERRWVIDKASKVANGYSFKKDILPHCDDDQLESVLTQLVTHGKWKAVAAVLGREVISAAQKKWAIEEASERAPEQEIKDGILCHCTADWLETVLKKLVRRGQWEAVQDVMNRGVSDALYIWAVNEASRTAAEGIIQSLVRICPEERICRIIILACQRGLPSVVERMLKHAGWDTLLSEAIVSSASLTQTTGDVTKTNSDITQPNREETDTGNDDRSYSLMSFVCEEMLDFIINSTQRESVKTGREPRISKHLAMQIKEWADIFEGLDHPNSLQMSSFECFFTLYYQNRRRGQKTDVFASRDSRPNKDKHLLLILTVLPIFTELQNAALRIMQRERRWDVISHARLTHVWEQVRRELLQAAVEQRQWSMVKQWSDHSLYDDHRGWALQEAFKEKQWDVLLLLADHGLMEDELMRAHYRLAKYADWDIVLQLLERRGNILELKELLQATKQGKKNLADHATITSNKRRRVRLARLWRRLAKSSVTDASAIAKSDWRLVLFRLRQDSHAVDVSRAVEAATRREAWHVVMQLARLGMNAVQRDSLFPEMIRRRQWGVCRVLLEQGVRVESCLAAVPELMKMNQWILLARLMEYDVDDAVRREITQHALERREGSVASQFISTMHGLLSVAEREELFEQSLSRGVWQALKPLVQAKDSAGIAHRDIAMQKAAEQRQWDVVDHCERYYADINKHNADGCTLLLQAAWRADWKAVEQLVYRGCDQFVLDSDGCSVLHKVLEAGQPDTAKLLIQFYGNINQPDRDGVTPLQMLIDRKHADIIDDMLFWQPDVCTGGLSKRGGTPLHAVCEAGRWKTMYYLVARGVDPLAVTEDGESVLMYAVQNSLCPQRMVAECIKLGFSTHQPLITDAYYALLDGRDKSHASADEHDGVIIKSCFILITGTNKADLWGSEHFSPFHFALVNNMPVIRDMLYESGSCSYRELFRLYTDVSNGRSFCHDVTTDLPYLQKVATTPRSLKSTCRLVISHCLNVRGKRHIDVEYLSLKRFLKNYVMFSDLTDPGFGKNLLP